MNASSIKLVDGGDEFDFVVLNGNPQPLQTALEDISRVGVDAPAYRQSGKRGRSFQMRGVRDFSTLGDATANLGELMDAQGSLCDICDDRGLTFTGAIALEVELISLRKSPAVTGGLSGSSPAWVLEVHFVFAATKDQDTDS